MAIVLIILYCIIGHVCCGIELSVAVVLEAILYGSIILDLDNSVKFVIDIFGIKSVAVRRFVEFAVVCVVNVLCEVTEKSLTRCR